MYLFLLYIVTIYAVNLGFTHVPLVDLGFGVFSPMAIVVGGIFVVRDFAQRAVGHYIWFGMILGCLLSYFLADPRIALASVISFAISEVVDWSVYTFTKRPFYKRILYSSFVSAPVDTFVFLSFINHQSVTTLVLMIACKMVAAIGVWYYGKDKETPTTPDGL